MAKITVTELAKLIPTEAAAYEYMESLRWPTGPVCPHCGVIGGHYYLKPNSGLATDEGDAARKTRTGSLSARRVWKCKDCRKQFSVITGTVFHGSKVSLRTWIFVCFEMCANKNGLAAREIERKYGLPPATAWYVAHRVREAMMRRRPEALLSGVVVSDETWIGGNPANKHRGKVPRDGLGNMIHHTEKTPVLSLVEKDTGEVRSQVLPTVNSKNLRKVFEQEVDMPRTVLHTDGATCYDAFDWRVRRHESVNHEAGEYVRGDVSTNRLENYFSQLKRSIDGTFHHVSREHLPRYLAEFDFRYSTCDLSDTARLNRLLERVGG
ncbi:MAG TPA: IS1595 family transposase, partial [Acidimicrobiales bacterium]|nr:IS1595 family transposase [Acidimicrobiales bacterium]